MVSKKTSWNSYDLTNNQNHYSKSLETFDLSNTPKAILWGQMQLQGGAFRDMKGTVMTTWFWKICKGLLFVMLVLAIWWSKAIECSWCQELFPRVVINAQEYPQANTQTHFLAQVELPNTHTRQCLVYSRVESCLVSQLCSVDKQHRRSLCGAQHSSKNGCFHNFVMLFCKTSKTILVPLVTSL